MQLEFHQFERRWEHLRVHHPGRHRRFFASPAERRQPPSPLGGAATAAGRAAPKGAGVRTARPGSRGLLTRLADKHGMPPCGDGPPALTGGSDDHGAFDIASTWTVTPPARSPRALLDHLRARAVAPGGAHGGSGTLAHSVGSLAAKGYLERGSATIPTPRGPSSSPMPTPG